MRRQLVTPSYITATIEREGECRENWTIASFLDRLLPVVYFHEASRGPQNMTGHT